MTDRLQLANAAVLPDAIMCEAYRVYRQTGCYSNTHRVARDFLTSYPALSDWPPHTLEAIALRLLDQAVLHASIKEQQDANERAAYWTAHAKALLLRKSTSEFSARLGELFVVADSVNAHRLIVAFPHLLG